MKSPEVLLCTGSHCRRALGRDDRVERSLTETSARVRRVGCQKVCKGPLVGVRVDGRWEWFERMSSKKATGALVELLERGELRKPLRNRWRKRRSGRVRG